MTVKLVEDWATTQVRRDIRDSLQSVGEPAILLALRHPGADADAARCDCHDDVYNDGETGCPRCYGTSFADPIKTAALVWAVFTDMVDAETLSDKGTFTPDQRIVQTEGYPRLMEHDVVVRVRRWNDDLPVEIEGFYGVQQVTVDSVRTGGRFGQYGWDIVGQKATCTRLSTSAPITQYPVLGQTFTAPVLPGKGPLSSPRPRP